MDVFQEQPEQPDHNMPDAAAGTDRLADPAEPVSPAGVAVIAGSSRKRPREPASVLDVDNGMAAEDTDRNDCESFSWQTKSRRCSDPALVLVEGTLQQQPQQQPQDQQQQHADDPSDHLSGVGLQPAKQQHSNLLQGQLQQVDGKRQQQLYSAPAAPDAAVMHAADAAQPHHITADSSTPAEVSEEPVTPDSQQQEQQQQLHDELFTTAEQAARAADTAAAAKQPDVADQGATGQLDAEQLTGAATAEQAPPLHCYGIVQGTFEHAATEAAGISEQQQHSDSHLSQQGVEGQKTVRAGEPHSAGSRSAAVGAPGTPGPAVNVRQQQQHQQATDVAALQALAAVVNQSAAVQQSRLQCMSEIARLTAIIAQVRWMSVWYSCLHSSTAAAYNVTWRSTGFATCSY